MQRPEIRLAFTGLGSGDMSVYKANGKKTTGIYAYDTGNRITGSVYTSAGEPIDIIDSESYSNPSISAFFSVSVFPMQAFDVFDGKIFQFKAGGSDNIENVMDVIDISTRTKIATSISVASGHGNSASFSGEYDTVSDAYPLMYVSTGSNPAEVHVNKVTISSTQLIRTYKFPLDLTGYYSQAIVDSENSIIYMVGSSSPEIKEDDGISKTIITKWDYSNSQYDEADGKYIPEFVSVTEADYFVIKQGMTFFDGYIWMISWDYNHQNNYIAVINPENGNVIQIIDLDIHEECEGIAFISATEAIVGVQGGTYKKLTFSN